ncbi:MAG: phosphoenolpyruvate--protein phosphotransferase [Phycisphaeraceae bacterium]|nr:phosphoenolpyruvate--protein phosphotransferase [Phycisphaeraceae bacterium]
MSNAPPMHDSGDSQPTARMILGEVASFGVARGTAVVRGCVENTPIARHVIEESEGAKEIERFDAAIVKTEEGMLRLRQQIGRDRGEHEAAIFDAHIAILHDPSLRETVIALCTTSKLNVETALSEAIDTLAAAFARLNNPCFRERAADLRDVGHRLMEALTKDGRPESLCFPDGTVLVTGELMPSVIAQLDEKAIRAVVVEQGGQTAHSTILARARGMPLLIHVPDATRTIHTGDRLIVDGWAGRVYINPKPEIQREYDRLEADLQAHKTALKGLIDLPSMTRDGTAIKLCANIGKVADAVAAAKVNADGVGLYRTEFVFLAQDHFPPEEDQIQMYRATANHMENREVRIRVLDIGSDKLLSYFPLAWEANPSLGIRGTRLLLAHPEILQAQLRAILRLSATHRVAILFPMVGGVEDLRAAKAAIERAKAGLAAEGKPFNPNIRVGAMIETPAAVIMIAKLVQEVDFLSVGTNDLVQYLLTTDRTSSEVAAYYEPLHPAVLQALHRVANEATAHDTDASICGEMAGNPAFTELLLGLGFRSRGGNPGEMLEIKNAIRATEMQAATTFAHQILQLSTSQEIKDSIRNRNTHRETGKGRKVP